MVAIPFRRHLTRVILHSTKINIKNYFHNFCFRIFESDYFDCRTNIVKCAFDQATANDYNPYQFLIIESINPNVISDLFPYSTNSFYVIDP